MLLMLAAGTPRIWAQAAAQAAYVQPGVTSVVWTAKGQGAEAVFKLAVLNRGGAGTPAASQFDLQVIDAKRDGVAVTVQGALSDNPPPYDHVLNLTLDLAPDKAGAKGGNVTVLVTLKPKSQPPAAVTPAVPAAQLLTFTLVPPKSKLQPLKDLQGKALKLEQTVWWDGGDAAWNDPATRAASVRLDETSGTAALHVQVADVGATAGATGRPDSGVLKFGVRKEGKDAEPAFDTPVSVPGSDYVELKPKIYGRFPLGSSDGTVRITAANMDAAVDFGYSIHVRRSTLWIFIIVALGFTLGWLVRKFLSSQVEATRARLAALGTLRELAAQREGFSEAPDYLVAHDEILQELLRNIGNKNLDAAALDQAVKRALEKHEVVVTKVTNESESQAKEIKLWQEALRPGWGLPPDIAQRIRGVETGLTEARQQAEKHLAPKAAEAKLAAAAAALLTLVKQASQWRLDMLKHLKVPADAAQGTEPTAEAVLAELAKEDPGPGRNAAATGVTPEMVTQELDATHRAWHRMQEMGKTLPEGVKMFAGQQASALESSKVGEDDQRKDVGNALRTAGEQFKSDLEMVLRTTADPKQLAQAVHTFKEAWKTALLTMPPVTPASDHALLLKQQVDAGDWAKAMETVTGEAPPGLSPLQSLGDSHQPASEPAGELPRGKVPQVSVQPYSGPRLDKMEKQLTGMAIALRFLHTTLLVLLFAGLAWLFLSGEWVGRYDEMGRLFLAAFFADITTDQLRKLAGNKPLPLGVA